VCGKQDFFVWAPLSPPWRRSAHKVQVKGDSDLLARGQLGCRRPLRHLCCLFIALLVGALGLALAKDVCAFAGHFGRRRVELTARVMDLGYEMF
jgi:hypothetical protein